MVQLLLRDGFVRIDTVREKHVRTASNFFYSTSPVSPTILGVRSKLEDRFRTKGSLTRPSIISTSYS